MPFVDLPAVIPTQPVAAVQKVVVCTLRQHPFAFDADDGTQLPVELLNDLQLFVAKLDCFELCLVLGVLVSPGVIPQRFAAQPLGADSQETLS